MATHNYKMHIPAGPTHTLCGLFWLGVQQLIIAGLALEALFRGRR